MSDTGERQPPTTTNPDPTAEHSARFGQTGSSNFFQTVHLSTDEVNIHQPSLAALERLARHSPEVANQLMECTKFVVKQDTKRFLGGAIVTGLVSCALLACSTITIIYAGFWAGIALFMASVVVSGVMVAALTGKIQDISWIVKVMPGRTDSSK